jgi:hypothetical protein
MSHKIKVTNDGYVWCIVTYAAPVLFSSGAMSIYELHDDDTESRIETHEDLQRALESGNPIGIDVGFLYTNKEVKDALRRNGYHTESLWHVSDVMDRYECDELEAYELLTDAIDRTIEDVNNEIDHLAEGNYKPKN